MSKKAAVIDEKVQQYNAILDRATAAHLEQTSYADQDTRFSQAQKQYEDGGGSYSDDPGYKRITQQKEDNEKPWSESGFRLTALLSEAGHVLDDLKSFDDFRINYMEQEKNGYRYYVRR